MQVETKVGATSRKQSMPNKQMRLLDLEKSVTLSTRGLEASPCCQEQLIPATRGASVLGTVRNTLQIVRIKISNTCSTVPHPSCCPRSSSDTQQRSRPSLQDPDPEQSSPRPRGLSLLPLIPN